MATPDLEAIETRRRLDELRQVARDVWLQRGGCSRCWGTTLSIRKVRAGQATATTATINPRYFNNGLDVWKISGPCSTCDGSRTNDATRRRVRVMGVCPELPPEYEAAQRRVASFFHMTMPMGITANRGMRPGMRPWP